jgi:hypothetical protein
MYEYGRDARDGPTMVSKNAPDFVQGATSDCSVIASLCALAANGGERRMQEVSFFFPRNFHFKTGRGVSFPERGPVLLFIPFFIILFR